MKKKLLIALLAIASTAACTFGVAACFTTPSNGGNGGNQSGNQQGGNEGEQNKNEYTVIFDANGGKFQKGDVEIDDDVTFDDGSVVSADGKKMTVTVSKGGLLDPPLKIPERSGYAFDGWYSDAECENEHVFDQSPLNGGKTLYAKWSITFNYALSADKSYYIVKGIGGLEGDVEVPDTYNLLPVLEIADGAFNKCSKLTGIVIADSVTKIGAGAFSECKNLVTVTLGNGITEIGASAFDGGWTGSGLKEITIPASVESIGSDAFSVCPDLEKVIYGGSINDWCNIEFAANSADSDAVLANNNTVLYIDDKPVTEATINTESINDLAFSNYKALKSVTLGAKVKLVGKKAFDSYGITTLNLNGATSLTEIGTEAFNNTSITSLKLPACNVYVGEEAFASCDYLTSVDLGGAKRIGKKAFYGSYAITTLNLGVVEEIEDDAFSFEQNSTSIQIPATLWYIGHRNFGNVKSVTFETPAAWYAKFSLDLSYSGGTTEAVELSAETLGNATTAARYFGLTAYGNGYNDCDWVKKAGELQYSVSGSTATVTGVNATVVGGVYIPRKYNNANVTKISGGALNSNLIKAVSIERNVSEIASNALTGCRNLQIVRADSNGEHFSVVDGVLYNKAQTQIVCVPKMLRGNVAVPDTITDIGTWFSGCKNLNQLITSVTSINSNALTGCESLQRLGLLMTESLPSGLLNDCVNLKEIIIPNVKGTLNTRVFDSCSKLEILDANSYCENYSSADGVLYNKEKTEIIYVPNGLKVLNVPETVTEIGWSGGASLKEINFLGNNGKYASINGVVYNKDFTEIVYIPGGITHFTVPAGITKINTANLDKCTSLKSITVAEGNKNYASRGGILYNKEQTKIIYIPKGIKELTYEMFGKNDKFTEIVIPDSVTSIEEDAFSGCNKLIEYENGVSYVDNWVVDYDGTVQNVTLRDGTKRIAYYAFKDKYYKLESITIPNSVTSIGDYVFEGCISLTSVTIPDSVTSIGNYSFSYCSKLTSITIPDSVTSIGEKAFYNCGKLTSITILDSVTSIGDYAFYGCSGLTSIVIPDSVTSIGDYVFEGCISLTSITIPDSVTSIGSHAFGNCSGLTSITIGNGVTSIDSYAFYGCSGLTSIVIPDSVTSIGEKAFYNCVKLTSITIPYVGVNKIDNSKSYLAYIFVGVEMSWGDRIPESLKTVIITGGTTIPDYAFYSCSGLTSIVIPDSVTSIGYKAFYNCGNLTSIVIPDSVTSIGIFAFFCCDNLTSIVIPDSVTSIGYSAFAPIDTYPPELTIYCQATSKPNGWDNEWYDDDHIKAIVWGYKGN